MSLTGKELKILEFPHHFLHDLVDIGLEFIDFALAVFLLQIFQDFLHVGLEVISEALLIAESGFDKSVVEHNIDTRLGAFISTFISLFGGGVGTRKNNFSLFTGLVLKKVFK